jgi:hypothetical protein
MKNTLIKVLSFVMALTMIVGMFTVVSTAAEHVHTKGDVIKTVAATCGKIGYTVYKCAECGDEFTTDVKPATGVCVPKDVAGVDATCDTPAVAAGTKCAECGKVLSGCTPVEGSKPLGHVFDKQDRVAATCDNPEYIQWTCTRCNKTADALLATDPYKKATVDAAVLADTKAHAKQTIPGTQKTHNYSEYEVTTAPTTCVNGVATSTCSNCGKTKTTVIKATHNFVAITNPTYPCVNGVLKEGATGVPTICSYCGVFADNTEAKEEVAHNYEVIAEAGDKVVAHGTNSKFAMGSKLQALGLKVGDALYKAPTCEEAGFALAECVCGAMIIKPLTADHVYNWSWKVGNTVVDTDDLNAAVEAKLCTDAISKVNACACGDVKETVVVVPAMNHVTKEETKAATCTTEGYVETKCDNCSYTTHSNYTPALGHAYGAWIEEGKCTDENGRIKYQKCTREGCGVTTTPVEIHKGACEFVVSEANHKYVAATCKTPAHYVYTCTYCDETQLDTTPGENGYIGKVNANNHTNLDFVDATAKYVPGKAATCTATGTFLKYCKDCAVVEGGKIVDCVIFEETAPKVDHTYGTICSSKSIDLSKVEATCQKEGKTAGEVCVNCGHIKTAQKTVEKNPHNHSGAKTAIKTIPANCLTGSYTLYSTACCGYVNVPVPDSVPTTTHAYETVAYKAPNCVENGNHKYEACKDCGIYKIGSIDLTSCGNACGLDHTALSLSQNYVIPNLGGHDWEDVDATAPTCTAYGTLAYSYCTRCTGVYKVNGNIIVDDGKASNGSELNAAITSGKPHGAANLKEVEHKDPTCTAKGSYGYTLVGEDKVWDSEIAQYVVGGKICTVCYKTNLEIPANGHTETDRAVNRAGVSAKYDCTKATYTIVECSVCNATLYAKDYTAGGSGHVWAAHPTASEVEGDRLCIEGTREAYACLNPYCTEYDYRVVKAPVAHSTTVNGAYVDMDLTCKNAAVWNGYECRYCEKTVKFEENNKETAEANRDNENYLYKTHNFAPAHKDVTCTEDGWDFVYCVDCGKTNPATPVITPAYNHNADAIIKNPTNAANYYHMIKYVAPTETADGYVTYICKYCNEENTVVIPAIKNLILNIAADGVAVSNNQVTVNVTASATDYAFNTIRFVLEIDPQLIALNNVKITYNFAAIDAVTVVSAQNDDYVEVFVYVPNGADGKAKNVSITGEDVAFLALTFDVLPTANADVAIEASDDTYNPAAIIENVYINDKGEATHRTIATGIGEINVAELKTTLLGDVNGDNRLDAGDSIAIQTAIYDGKYNVAADFNKDGKIDLADHVAFVKFITSKQSVADYLAAMGIDLEAVVIAYNLKYDLDNDRAVGTANDKAVLAKLIVDTLSDVPYNRFTASSFNTIEEYVEFVASSIASGKLPA